MVHAHPTKFVYYLILVFLGVAVAQRSVPVKVGVVLDLTAGIVGKMGLSCINISLSDFYLLHPHYKTRLQFIITDSHRDVVTAAAKALDLIKNEEVQAIMGPTTTMEANFVIGLGDKAHVPIITFSATSPSLISLQSPYFFQMAQNDLTQVKAISALVQAFGWKEVVPIFVDNSYGKGVISCLTNTLQQAYVRIPYLSFISLSATDEAIDGELYKLMTMQTRVFVVHMSPSLGTRFLTIARHIGMMGQGYVWIVTDGIANFFNSLDSSEMESIEGVLGVRPYIPRTKELDDFKVRWKRKFLRDNPTLTDTNLNVYGIWAYDATTALAMAAEKVGTTNYTFRVSNNTSSNVTDLENFGISQNGVKLREALSNTRFKGLGGEFSVVGGQLQTSIIEIVNVVGNGEKRVGFWTPQMGLTRDVDIKSSNTLYSTCKKSLKPIIWPGDKSSVPKGWEIPTNGKKLRIGVPVKDGYTEFVKVTHDPSTNSTEVTGFCIDVFKAVVEALPYALTYEFIPFQEPSGEAAGTYDDLVSQVYYGEFDAIVGDTTIVANRSKYVDFTLPYTESGVTMVVPVKDNRKKNAWAFLKPLTWDLWVTTACSFVFIGLVVWALEHRVNKDFRGPPSHQIGTSLWFSFSILVFAHRERVMSNLGRFVVMVWVFVVLILVQSYTASLTSLLTVEQLRPAITDVHQLLQNKMNVGYLGGSFVYRILKDLGFQDFQLKIYKSAEECNELFTKGSANGGIAAAFDEVPYVHHFLGIYCSKYTMLEPRFKTGGFGFVFSKGSPLVADISRAILNVTQGDKMKRIEHAWLKENGCPESNAEVSSNSLGLESFWGLFLIAGIASLLALLICAISFLYQHRHIWLHYNPSTSIRRRIGILLRIFYQKDPNCHTFKKSMMSNPESETSCPHCHHDFNAVETSPSTHCLPSPSSQTESKFSFDGDQGMFSPDHSDADASHKVGDVAHGQVILLQNITPEIVSADNLQN